MLPLLTAPLLALCASSTPVQPQSGPQPALGPWRAVLTCPGGEIPFRLDLVRVGRRLEARIHNASEVIEVRRVEASPAGELVFHIEPYDSRLRAQVGTDGKTLSGTWERYRNVGEATRLPFHASAGDAPRFGPGSDGVTGPRDTTDASALDAIAGRWRVDFDSDEHDAVAVFEVLDGGRVGGTFLTTLGDYRYLEGAVHGRSLYLSVFDGAHAFRFVARLQQDGSLAGDFWSRDSWHETWTAVKDDEADLPDAFGLTTWTGAVPLADLVFPDTQGVARSLADPAFAGRARILTLFGTWCPNCNDATRYLVELDGRYRERGLSIVGLAFEFGDDAERNARQVQHYGEQKGVRYPLLIAGTSDKKAASQAFPVLDRVRAFPTTVFLDAAGKVRAVHTGFSGPATGAEHERLRERFEGLIEELLGEGE